MTPPPAPSPLRSPLLAALSGVEHGFSTRLMGTARPPGPGPEPDAVDGAVGAGWRRRQLHQVHGCAVVAATDADGQEGDALVTDRPGDLLVVRTADCLAALLVARDASGAARAVAAVHAGWRGLVAGVLPAAVAALRRLAPEAELLGALGPAIGPCCFEVGPDVAAAMVGAAGPGVATPGPRGRPHADLPGAGLLQLRSAGVRVAAEPPPCTRCDPARFHSHRADGERAGRLGAWIGLRTEARR